MYFLCAEVWGRFIQPVSSARGLSGCGGFVGGWIEQVGQVTPDRNLNLPRFRIWAYGVGLALLSKSIDHLENVTVIAGFAAARLLRVGAGFLWGVDETEALADRGRDHGSMCFIFEEVDFQVQPIVASTL